MHCIYAYLIYVPYNGTDIRSVPSGKKKKKEQCNVVQYPAALTPQRISRNIPH